MIFCVPLTCPLMGSLPMESGCGSPAVPLRKDLLALAAAFCRGFGKGKFSSLSHKTTCPLASIGASRFSVVLLHAIGLPDNRADKTWLT